MKGPLDEPYFTWLSAKVVLGDRMSQSYLKLLRQLYETEFVWFMIGDDNRARDGLDLRHEFLRESRLDNDPVWFEVGCSVLEMLIGLSRRAEFQTDLVAQEWFWVFIRNLNLADYHDENAYNYDHDVSEILYDFVWRTYEYDGTGGLFPMKNPPEDQREVEIWYQFSEYLVEQGM